MFCTRCGKEFRTGMEACPFCGQPAWTGQQPTQANPPTNQYYAQQATPYPQMPYNKKPAGADGKKIAVILLGVTWLALIIVVMLLVFTKCDGKNDQIENETPAAAEIVPEDVPDAPEEPVPEEAQLPDKLVTDAFRDETHRDVYGESGIYAVPQINLEGAEIAALNAEIYETIYDEIVSELVEDWNENSCGGTNVDYEWAQNGDTLSIVIEIHPTNYYWTEFYVYNVSVSERRLLRDAEVIDRAGISNFRQEVKKAIEGTFWDRVYAAMLPQTASDAAFFNQLLDQNRSSSNIDRAVPYLNLDGELCAICYIYSMAGAEGYYESVNLAHYPYPRGCDGYMEMPSPTMASDDYIIYDSDTRLISESELWSLTEHECWLALNEIYAHHGRLFAVDEIADYFNSKSWYFGFIDGSAFDQNLSQYLSKTEQKNAETIIAYQKRMGWRS